MSGGKDNIRRPELAGISPSSSTQTSFVECEICHVIVKSVRDLGNHKRENHPAVMKQKVCSGPLPSNRSTPSPVLHGNQKTATSPVLLPGQIGCPVCKIGCNDKQTLTGHVGAEYPSHKFMCDEANCFKVYISKSGLFKHKKHTSLRKPMTVFCVWTLNKHLNEEDCDNHNCPAWSNNGKQKRQSGSEPPENGEGESTSNGKRKARSSKIKKEK